MLERILVPLDGSPRAEIILSQIARLIRREDSEIILMRAVHVPSSLARRDVGVTLREERTSAQQYIHDLARRMSDAGGAKVHGRVVEGLPAQAILETAGLEGATMIAMSTHGRTGLARWVLGSVAEKVARSSDVPVLLVRSFRPTPQADLEPVPPAELPVRKILVPTDGSDMSMAAAIPARKLALLFGSQVVALHVHVPYVSPGPVLPGMEGPSPALPVEAPASDEDPVTEKLAKRFEQAGVAVTRRTVTGDPAASILDLSFEAGVDLIVLATHGRSGITRFMLGSVAERVLRHATVPILLVRAPAEKGAGRKKRTA